MGGLVTLQNKTVEGITCASISVSDQSSQNRFLTASTWSEQELEQKYFSVLRREFAHESAFLVIDDTLNEKTGHAMEEAQYHRDHCSNGFLFGHQCVTALLTVRGKLFPLFPRLYSKKTESKIDIAKEIIVQTAEKIRLRSVLLDSWYVTTDIVKLCLRRKIDVIGCLKSNRNVSLCPGQWKKLGTWAKTLKEEQFTPLEIDDETYRVHEVVGRFKHIGVVKILVTQQWNEQTQKWSKLFFLMATNTTLTPAYIIRTYLRRWTIETFHRDVKQHLGFGAYQMRKKQGITRHLILATLAFAILKLWMLRHNVQWTIGQVIRHIQEKLFDTLLLAIVEEPLQQRRWEMVEPFIRKTAKA